jgi:hypothetical protein
MRFPARLRIGANDKASAQSCAATSGPLKDKPLPFGEDQWIMHKLFEPPD